jgi:release factor glutamine methyltransferase
VTIREILKKTAGWLAGKGFESARLESELLLAHVLQTDRVALYTDSDRPLVDSEIDAYRELVRRRGQGEPVAYLTGRREFYGLEMKVTPDVLVPRPETELLVDLAREIGGASILDLCTGSGCVAVAIAVRLPEASVVAADVSEAALEVARGNAARHGVEERIEFFCGDLFEPLEAVARFDLVLANPPYVADGEMTETAGREPDAALFAGPKGTEVIERIFDEAPARLCPGGALVMEFGESQEPEVAALAGNRFARTAVHRDLQGHPRVFVGYAS